MVSVVWYPKYSGTTIMLLPHSMLMVFKGARCSE